MYSFRNQVRNKGEHVVMRNVAWALRKSIIIISVLVTMVLQDRLCCRDIFVGLLLRANTIHLSNICVQCWTNVEDVWLTLYKCHTIFYGPVLVIFYTVIFLCGAVFMPSCELSTHIHVLTLAAMQYFYQNHYTKGFF